MADTRRVTVDMPQGVPTIGRIVRYAIGNTVYAAIIVAVHVDGKLCDLEVFGIRPGAAGSNVRFPTNVPYAKGGESGTWRWPPRE